MCALAFIARVKTEELFESLNFVLDAMEKGTVITNDAGIKIIVTLGAHEKHKSDCLTLLMEQLLKAPINQLPAYAESTAIIMNEEYKAEFINILLSRLETIEQESKRNRILKVIGHTKKIN
jgi:hypothetical protein